MEIANQSSIEQHEHWMVASDEYIMLVNSILHTEFWHRALVSHVKKHLCDKYKHDFINAE